MNYSQRRASSVVDNESKSSAEPESTMKFSDAELAKVPDTDLGNATRLMKRYGEYLIFCGKLAGDGAGWRCWDKKRWKDDLTGQAERYAKYTVRRILAEAATIEDQAKRNLLVSWAMQSQSNSRIKAMLSLAKTEIEVVVTLDQLDTDLFLFNCENGTFNLQTGELQEHDKADLITKLGNVTYDANAKCPVFDKFITEITCGDKDLERYLQQRLGHSLSGDISVQLFDVWFGGGENGKNTLYEVMLDIFGDYGCTAAPDLLIQSKGKEHSCELADLFGARFVICSESPKGAKLKSELVKSVTGDKHLKARFMRQNHFEFLRTFKTFHVTNNKPVIDESSRAIWRRVKLVPFAFKVEDIDYSLDKKLAREKSGIFNWLLEGFADWQISGIIEPEKVQVATEQYKSDSNLMERWADECLVISTDAHFWCPSKKLSDSHKDWCSESGFEVDMPGVWDYLQENGCHGGNKNKRQNQRGWVNVTLASEQIEVRD